MSLQTDISPYRSFTADEWGRLRKDAELTLTEAELEKLRGLGETVSLAEVEEIIPEQGADLDDRNWLAAEEERKSRKVAVR